MEDGELVSYVCHSSEKKVTNKVALNGYAYTKRGGKGSVSYWYCDQRKICSASLLEKGGVFSAITDRCSSSSIPGVAPVKRGWGQDGTHESHQPDYERVKREITTRKRRQEVRRRALERRALKQAAQPVAVSSENTELPPPVHIESSVDKTEQNDLKIEFVWSRDTPIDEFSLNVPSDDTSIPVLVDTDGGFYDAWAISMLLTCDQSSLHKYHVVGITTVNGVTTVENALQNVHRVLKTIGGKSERIPVYQGMESPMVSHGDSIRRPSFFGSDGFGDAFPPEEISSYATSTHAVNAIIKFAEKYKGKLVVLGLGPLTNLAMAVKMQPLIKSMIKEVYILGGNAEGVGNVTVCSEFNFHVDPEAAQVVLENFTGCPIYLLPWETCLRSSSTYAFRTKTLGSSDRPLMHLLNKIESKHLSKNTSNWIAPDALIVGCFMKKVIRKTEEFHCSVELQGKHTRGMMVVDKNFLKQRPPNVILISELDVDMHEGLLLEMAKGRSDKETESMNMQQLYF